MSGVVVLDLVIVDVDRYLADGVALLLGQIAGPGHSLEDGVATLKGLVGIETGVVSGGFVDHAHEHGALLNRQFGRLLVEERQGCCLDAVSAAAEEDGVEIHVHDLLLGIVPFELHCGDPLLELGPDHDDLGPAWDLAVHLTTGIQGLGQLLGDGTSAALAGVSHEQGLEEHAAEADHVDAGMPVETLVLGSDGRLDKAGGQFIVTGIRAVLDMEGGQDLASVGDHLGGKLAVRVLQLLEGRDLGEDPYEDQKCQDQRHGSGDEYPEPLGYFLASAVFHIIYFSRLRRVLEAGGQSRQNYALKFGKLPSL